VTNASVLPTVLNHSGWFSIYPQNRHTSLLLDAKFCEGIASSQVALLVAIFGYRITRNLHAKNSMVAYALWVSYSFQ